MMTKMSLAGLVAAVVLVAAVLAQNQFGPPENPFPKPVNITDNIITVKFVDFARITDIEGEAPRMMLLSDEPGTRRLFVNTMRGPLFSVSYDGKTVTQYVDINDPKWNVNVQSANRERGFQSFAFHPDFNQRGARGYGKFYTFTDTSN